jgi:hypothetical protein
MDEHAPSALRDVPGKRDATVNDCAALSYAVAEAVS